jgi:chloramphenicol 3-O-phosphotransferase
MSGVLTWEETQELLKLCRHGHLFAIQKWITAGKSIQLAPAFRKTLLSAAIKTEVHSLVEVIAPHETQAVKNKGLAEAVAQRRADFVKTLVACGAEVSAIPFGDVLLCSDTEIIRVFLDNGADVITDDPFAMAFIEGVRTAFRKAKQAKIRARKRSSALIEGYLQRFNRGKLYEEVWMKPMTELTKKYGLSSRGLAKVFSKLHIPVPGRGYWAKKIAGREVEERPLLPAFQNPFR